MRKLGIPPENLDPLRYAGPRVNLTPVTEANRRPAIYDRDYPLNTYWRTKAPTQDGSAEGELWYLAKFTNGDAIWLMLSTGGSGPLLNIETDDGPPNVIPDGLGEIQIFGGAGITVTGQGPGKTVTVALVGGGIAIDSIDVDDNTPPGTDPVVPDGTGLIIVTGGQTAPGTIANIIQTNSLAANTYTIQIQQTSTAAAKDTTLNGVSHFNSTQFTNDEGFISLAGGGIAIDSIDVDDNTPPGTDPVVPDGAGQITVTGGQVAAGTIGANAIRTNSLAANTYTIEIQRANSNSIAGSTVNDAGIASYLNEHFDLDANAQVSIAERLRQLPLGTTFNIGFTYSSPDFTVHGADGTALSTTNPGWVVIGSKSSPGERLVIKVTANQSFEDTTGTGDMDGNTFGTTAGTAWAENMPIFVYAVLNDSENAVAFMNSRVPTRRDSPAAAKIAKAGSAVATTQGSFFMFDSALTVGDYDSNPCVCIGSHSATKSAADDWTIATFGTSDGVGYFAEGRVYQYPTVQNGATSTYWSSSVGGDTIPTFAQINAAYKITKDGYVEVVYGGETITVNGVGAGNLRLHFPYNFLYTDTPYRMLSNFSRRNTGAGTYTTFLAYLPLSSELAYTTWVFTGTGTAILTPAGMTTDSSLNGISIYYPISNS